MVTVSTQKQPLASAPLRSRLRSGGGALLLAGVTSVLVFVLTQQVVERKEQRQTALLAREIAGTLRAHLVAPLETLAMLNNVLELPGRGGLSLAQFQQLSRAARHRQPGIAAFWWCPVVQAKKRDVFEAFLSREQPGFQVSEPNQRAEMQPAGRRSAHLPLTYSDPADPEARGFDLNFDEQRRAAAHKALSTNSVVLSRHKSPSDEANAAPSLIAYAPVEHASWVDDQRSAGGDYARGVVVAELRLSTMIEGSLHELDEEQVKLKLTDPGASTDLQFLYQSPGELVGKAVTVVLPIADRRFLLQVYPAKSSLGWWAWSSAGSAFVLVLSGLLWIQTRRRARALERSLSRLGVYQLEGKIASGGMGTVFKAQHALLKRPTAIKIASNPELAGYFAKEVLLTSRLSHPNTVLVYDFGRGQDGSFYYAMEYIEGYDLQKLVELHGPLPDGRVVRLLLQVAGSLKEAHDRGLVHRDIKPSNIMITERGGLKDFVKVLDFGLVKHQSDLLRTETFPSLGEMSFAGTPGYVAPEVIAGAAATPQADIFALGGVAYFLLAGKAPFASATAVEALTKALNQQAPPLPSSVHPDLDRLIRQCLERNPEHRPRSVQAITDELRRLLPLCQPWRPAQIEAWWAEHPPAAQLERLSTSLTFLLRHGSELSEHRRAAGVAVALSKDSGEPQVERDGPHHGPPSSQG